VTAPLPDAIPRWTRAPLAPISCDPTLIYACILHAVHVSPAPIVCSCTGYPAKTTRGASIRYMTSLDAVGAAGAACNVATTFMPQCNCLFDAKTALLESRRRVERAFIV